MCNKVEQRMRGDMLHGTAHMNGGDPSGACAIIAMREMLGDARWSDVRFEREIKRLKGVSNSTILQVAKEYDLVVLDSFHIPSQNANNQYVECWFRGGKGTRLRIGRTAPVLFAYNTGASIGHIVCMPAHMLICMSDAFSIELVIFGRGGIYDNPQVIPPAVQNLAVCR